MTTFTKEQMLDPWGWCLHVLDKHEVTSKWVAEVILVPRSTIRALFNGTNTAPRYDLLRSLLKLCIDIEEKGVKVITTERLSHHSRVEDLL